MISNFENTIDNDKSISMLSYAGGRFNGHGKNGRGDWI
jgi:hypothetical protein